jgi:hypothetical protein
MGLWADYLAWVRREYGAYGEAIAENEMVEGTGIGAITGKLLNELGESTTEFIEGAASDAFSDFSEMDWEAIGTGIGNAIAAVLEASGGIIGGVGKQLVPNLIEGVEIGYDKIREKLDGQESNVIAAFTVGFLVIFTFAYAFYEIRRGK